MAEKKTTPATPKAEETKDVSETPTIDPTVVHVEGDTYEVNGVKIEGETRANEYSAALKAAQKQLNAPDFSDVIPEKYDPIKIKERLVRWRDNLRELPMNETHYPDGDVNPMYDRMYQYAWGSYSDRSSVPDRLAKGYELVSKEDLEQLIEDQKCPDLYRHMLRPEGRYLVYGDDVLLRIPRVLQRQRKDQRDRYAIDAFQSTERKNREGFDRIGARPAKSSVANEVSIKF